MQLLTDFIEQVYFPAKNQPTRSRLARSSWVTTIWYQHDLKSRISGKRVRAISRPVWPSRSLRLLLRSTPPRASHYRQARCSAHQVVWRGCFRPCEEHRRVPDDYENPFFRVKIPKTKAVSQPTAVRNARRGAGYDRMCRPIPQPRSWRSRPSPGCARSQIQGLQWEDLRDGERHITRSAWRTTTLEDTKTAASNAPVPVLKILA